MFTEIAHSQNVFSLHTILQLYHSNNLDTQKIHERKFIYFSNKFNQILILFWEILWFIINITCY